MKYKFEIPGQITGKARPRMNTRTGRAYTPTKTKCYEYFARECFILQYNNFIPLEGRIKLKIQAFYEIPKSTSNKKIEEMLNNNISPTKKPDIDNVVKIILDALNKFAYKDDTQVTKLEVIKQYANTPNVIVEFEEY